MTATDDGTALLRAILLHPEEDTPRLVYADWLQDRAAEVTCAECGGNGRRLRPHRGEEGAQYVSRRWEDCWRCHGTGTTDNGFGTRATFVRLQCAPGYVPDWTDKTAREPGAEPGSYKLTREQRMHHACLPGWNLCGWNPEPGDVVYQRPYDEGPGRGTFRVRFVRGFAERVELSCADFLKHAADLFAAHPITGVRLTDREPSRWHLSAGFQAPAWFLFGLSVPPGRAQLPAELLELVAEDERCQVTSDTPLRWAAFDGGEADAHAALSAACVAYGRRLAGLPVTEGN